MRVPLRFLLTRFPALFGVVLFGLACAGIRPYPRYTCAGDRHDGGVIGRSREKMEKVIESFLGTPYRWGGEGENGVDCSGLVRAVFRQAMSLRLPHSTQELFGTGATVSLDELCFGDLVFFGEKDGQVNHVGIYLSGGRFVHASTEQGVTISRLDSPYFRGRCIGARRIVL